MIVGVAVAVGVTVGVGVEFTTVKVTLIDAPAVPVALAPLYGIATKV